MDGYQFHQTLNEFEETLANFLITALTVILFVLIIAMIVKSYFDLLSGLYKLNLRCSFVPRGICFGKHGLKYVYSPADKEGHVAVVSKSGGGKTTSILVPTIRSWIGENYNCADDNNIGTAGFYIDISGDIVSNIDFGDPTVRIIEPLNPSTLVYDVFGKIRLLSDRITEVDALIALSYILIPEKASDDAAIYYEKTGRQMLQATLISLYFDGLCFLDICRLVSRSTAKALIDKLVSLKIPEAIPYFIKFDDLTPQQVSNIFDSVHDALEQFANPAVAHAFDTSRQDVEILNAESVENYNLFLVLPDNKKDQYSIMLRIITEQILNHIAERPLYTGKRILLAIDEFGSFGKLNILEAAEKYRKRFCRLIILFQDIKRIDKNWDYADRESLFSNMEYVLCLGTSAHETQMFLADRIGKKKKKKKSYNTKTGVTTSEQFAYPVEPYRFGKCRWRLYVISENEYMKLRKTFIPELHKLVQKAKKAVSFLRLS